MHTVYRTTSVSTHFGGTRVEVRQVDGAGVQVDDSHGDTLSLQGGEVADVDSADLEAVDRGIRLGASEAKREILRVEHGDLLLNEGQNSGEGYVGGKVEGENRRLNS